MDSRLLIGPGIPTPDPTAAWNISSISPHRLMELSPGSTALMKKEEQFKEGARAMRTPSNIFIINLAITDFLMCLTQTPIFFITSMHKRWIFGKKGCELYAFCGALFGICSMMTLMVIAVDRYTVITRPLASLGVMSRRKALSIAAAAWVYSMGWSLPPFFGWSAYVPEGLMTSCSWDYMTFTPSVRSYTILLFTFVFFIPLSIIIFSYCCIFRAIRHTTRAITKINTRDSAKRFHKMKSEWKMAKIALIVILLFVISWAPYSCAALTAFAGHADLLTPYMNSVPAVIAKASAIYNPIVYAITHPKYRSALSKYIPYLGALLCVTSRDRFSSSSFQSTRRSTLTSQSEIKGPGKPHNSSLSESESARFSDTEEDCSSRTLVSRRQLYGDTKQVRHASQRSKMRGHNTGEFERTAAHNPTDPAICLLSQITTLTEPEDISMSDINLQPTSHLPATMSSYTVTLNGPAPWGFRLQGGKDFNMPLTISRITPGSKAVGGSLAQGDIITAIDGVSTEGMTHLEAQNKIKSATTKLSLTMLNSSGSALLPSSVKYSQCSFREPCAEKKVREQQPEPCKVFQDKKPSKGNLFQVPKNDPELLSTPNKAPASSTPSAASPSGRPGQYNSPIGLYSPETLREIMLMQGKLGEGSAGSRGHSWLGNEANAPHLTSHLQDGDKRIYSELSIATPPFIPLTRGTISGAYTQTYLAGLQANGKSGVRKRAPGGSQDDDGSIVPGAPPHRVIANTAANVEYTPSFNPIALKDSALSTHKPIEVKGPGGKATIVHAQYNTPISMYSQDAIMDAIAGQSQAKGHDSGALPVKDPVVDCASPVYQAVIRPGESNQDMSEWARRAANLQSKSFRILAHITGTEYLQDPDEEALQRSRHMMMGRILFLPVLKLCWLCNTSSASTKGVSTATCQSKYANGKLSMSENHQEKDG
ncbi:hypothetical protein L3Q82_010230 [Scortum barcoo]|uniref:Uncharacterized protein n=1 Tax=Scortum barcoo TaxID=214431 RepID=A0ACB8WB46_9TELE|nr:hypothetical protein L3Q82_010230 [Scortum barcoo]